MGSARSAGIRGLGKASTAAGLGISVVALAGCGGGADQPITSPSPKSFTTTTVPTTSATSSATAATTSVTTAPSGGTSKGYNGAVDLVTTYVKRYNQVNREGRLDLFDGLYSSACTDCAFLRGKIADRLAKGIKPDGDIFTPLDIGIEKYHPHETPITAQVLAQVVENPVRFLDPSGKVTDTYDREETTFRFYLEYSDRWIITSLRKVQ